MSQNIDHLDQRQDEDSHPADVYSPQDEDAMYAAWLDRQRATADAPAMTLQQAAGRCTIRGDGVTVETPSEAVTVHRDGSVEIAMFSGPVTTTWAVD
jgi:hypothetical protein